MTRACLALLLFALPAFGQQITVECNNTHCAVPIQVLNALLAQAKMNCGPSAAP